MEGRWWQAILAVMIVDFALEIMLSFFISSTYLIYLITDIIGAFVYAFVYLPYPKTDLLRDPNFHYLFSSTLVMFLVISLIFILIGII
jgi:hypothetical protein